MSCHSGACFAHKNPVMFGDFFDSGLEESVSPFLLPSARVWARHLPLITSILSLLILLSAYVLQYFSSLGFVAQLLVVFVYFLSGSTALIHTIEDLLDFNINIDVLMTIAAFLSIGIDSAMEGALLLVLFSLSGAIEQAVDSKAKSSLRALNKLMPKQANVMLAQGKFLSRSIDDVRVGDQILIRSGDMVPLDGIVVHGTSSLNLAHLTGEFIPMIKNVGDTVPAGSVNGEGSLILKVTHINRDSTLSKIVRLVTQAEESKPKLQRWFEKFSRLYASLIIGTSAFVAIFLPFFMQVPYLGAEGSIYRALAFLIAASPCALIIAMPIVYLSALSVCAKHGIVIKGGYILDAIAACQHIAFDKTGTLTTGKLELDRLDALSEAPAMFSESFIFSVALSLEKKAVHPVAQAIVQAAENRSVSSVSIEEFKSIPGYGVEGKVSFEGNTHFVYVGNKRHILQKTNSKQIHSSLQEYLEKNQQTDKILSFLLVDQSLYAFVFSDQIRLQVKELVNTLETKLDMKTCMLTGDHEEGAKKVFKTLKMSQYFADLKPEDKLVHVTNLSEKGGLIMVGDGINDAPALVRATVGISMGQIGAAVAVEASDVVLLKDEITLLPWLIQKAKMTVSIVRQNVILASTVIVFASFLALCGVIPLWLAVILHEGGTVLVGLNGLRLLRKKSL